MKKIKNAEKRKKKKKNAKKEGEAAGAQSGNFNPYLPPPQKFLPNKIQFKVLTLQIKPEQKVNHHKIITEQKHHLDRLKLENLELQTT